MAVQTSIYFALSTQLLLVNALLAGPSMGLDQIFDYHRMVELDTAAGWTLLFCHLLIPVWGSLALLFLVQRAKLCLDFTCTFYGYHLIFVWIYTGQFPSSFIWWIVLVMSVIGMTVLGEFLSMRRELEPILLSTGSGGGGSRGVNAASVGVNKEEVVDIEMAPRPSSSSRIRPSDGSNNHHPLEEIRMGLLKSKNTLKSVGSTESLGRFRRDD